MSKFKIFVGGVHGSGKGTISRQLVNYLMCEYISTSKLLQWDSKSKQVEDVRRNQVLLTELFNKYIRNDTSYIIDGHFSLWNKNNECEIIPLQTFKSLDLDAIIVTTCAVEVIHERLIERDGIDYKLIDIANLQELEIKQAREVAKNLSIPFVILETTESYNFQDFLNKLKT